ncbi:hypothetical protein PICMEDRAFT_148045 [Pichia membranifaciens NRRL Y-2026]|uniref:Uncharacterized protein n=1 Tax=Pichia membranifaciens NRRL Y-2026 TaxID=763406 RepID=A0A1E3NIK2_9ASCO|nr:hypothetical protein PICMEDRAFT_148045 [Pichia membranifaciens NRRL Y-2026]ODQ45959.1 hypothetical protein PICMEDRAFT_148045 [Pichia membranifaciens NRRL Y-2026]
MESSRKKRNYDSENYIKIDTEPSFTDRQTIMNASKIVNTKLQSRGNNKLKFFTLEPPKKIQEVYNHDKQVINIISSLLTELEMSKKLGISQEKLMNEKAKEKAHWKKLAGQAEIIRLKNERRIRDLEVEALKLKFTVDDLKERKKGVEQRVREIKNGWETYKCQVTKEKLRAEINIKESVKKLKLRYHPNENGTASVKRQKIERDSSLSNKVKSALLNENERAQNDLCMIFGFIQNLYKCLEKLKASDGGCPIDRTFLVNRDKTVEFKNDLSVPHLLTKLDSDFRCVLNEIKNEPFGTDDTFRSKRIGVEKQREIVLLKERLSSLQKQLNKAVDTIEKDN